MYYKKLSYGPNDEWDIIDRHGQRICVVIGEDDADDLISILNSF